MKILAGDPKEFLVILEKEVNQYQGHLSVLSFFAAPSVTPAGMQGPPPCHLSK